MNDLSCFSRRSRSWTTQSQKVQTLQFKQRQMQTNTLQGSSRKIRRRHSSVCPSQKSLKNTSKRYASSSFGSSNQTRNSKVSISPLRSRLRLPHRRERRPRRPKNRLQLPLYPQLRQLSSNRRQRRAHLLQTLSGGSRCNILGCDAWVHARGATRKRNSV